MSIKLGPVIPKHEFSRRIKRAAELARAQGLDVPIINCNEADFANVRYFSDFWVLFEIAGVAISPQGEAALMVGPESGKFAADRSKIERIHQMLEYRESADPAYPGVAVSNFKDVFSAIGVSNPKRIGIAGYLITTAPVLDALRQTYPKAKLERADRIMVELRSIKSNAELACLRRAFEICEIATKAVIAEIKPGMTELQAVGIAQKVMYANGAEYEGHPTYVLSGSSSAHAISRPTHKVMKKGELVQLNIGARVSGYSSSVGIPVCFGKMDSKMRDLVEFGLEAHNQTISWIKAGVIAADIARKFKKLVIDRGYGDNYLYGPCHGLGMLEVEPPWVEEISQYPLQENMTFQVDTFLSGKQYGLRWENGIRVKKNGYELFSGKFRKIVEIM